MIAAEASVCAAEQGRFWPVHDALFAFFRSQSALSPESVAALGEAAGLDTAQFSSCLSDHRAQSTVSGDSQAADGLGIEGTPALFINGRPLRGALSEQLLAEAVEEELARELRISQ
jgi:protein-disulfide isomerase